MGVRRGGQELALPPPPLAVQNSVFFDLYLKENRMLLPSWKILPSPGKSLRTPMS